MLRQKATPRPDSIPLRERDRVEVQGAPNGHAIVGRRDHFGGQATNRPRGGNDDDLVHLVNYVVSGKNQNRPRLIGEGKAVPADISTLQATFSQSSLSQVRASPSEENSVLEAGVSP